ncbi:unknown [Clostridium sp. CAG:1219]|nr:unknown [Clostridium sp. CAG:1219]
MRCKYKKSGSINIIIVFILVSILITIFINVYVAYQQVNTMISPVKMDMFYIVQNAIISFNSNELMYYQYKVDNSKLKTKVEEIIKHNYNDRVNIKNLEYDMLKNQVKVEYTVIFEPVVFVNLLGKRVELKFIDYIKIKNMEIK